MWRQRGALISLVLAVFLPGSLPLGSTAYAQVVRLGYVIPENREPQTDGVENLRAWMLSIQDWYGDQMERFGFGQRTFQLEMEPDGVTPLVHVVNASVADDYLRDDVWSHTIGAAGGGGLSVWSRGELWVLIPEAHLQQPDGNVTGGTALGASYGSGDDPGVAMVGSDMLPRAHPSTLLDTTPYDGRTIPEIGPYPLVQDVSFPWFEGTTISSIASSAQGALAHEMGHGFGLPHDFRNDGNFDGNLMGNGLRGWRGARFPQRFPGDDTQLGLGAALTLSTSRYFNPDGIYTDNVRPQVNVTTSGSVDPVNGQLEVQFEATDVGGLASASLRRNGNQIAELSLAGTIADTSFLTPYFEVGQQDEYAIVVYDESGNKQTARVDIKVNTFFNRAPQPFLALDRSTVNLGESVLMDVSHSVDPDHALSSLTVEWDLDGDGTFDTMPSFDKSFSLQIVSAGPRLVSARLTDPAGAWAVSAPLSILAIPEPSTWASLVVGAACLGFIGCRRFRRAGSSSARFEPGIKP